MKAGRTLSLRARLVVWISAVILATGIGSMVSVYVVSSRTLKAQAEEDLARIVDKTAGELDVWIGDRQRDAVNLSQIEVFADACAGRNLAGARALLEGIHHRSPFYENVFLADSNGKLFLDSIGDKSVGVDIMSIQGYRPNAEHARQGEVWVSEVMKSPATGRPVSLITAPVNAGGKYAGILGTPIELSDFSASFVSKYHIGQTGYLFLVDAGGTVLAHPNASKVLTLNILTLDFGREMLNRATGSIAYTYEGIAKFAHFQRAKAKPWTVAATINADEMLASARTIQIDVVLFGLVSLAGAIVALWLLTGKLSRVIGGITMELEGAVREFFASSAQISSSAQSLAQASSEQAASLEETSASAEEISAITRQNQQRSRKMAQLMTDALPIVRAVSTSQQELGAAIAEVSASSEKVSRVIKMIDEIAFQTNILALNAAVEAARAGESGMGFAVVADEVRNLAHRSANAAQETSGLIEESLAKSRESRQKLEGTLKAIEANNVITSAAKVETDAIHSASKEQAQGIVNITSAIAQMNQVTQSTAAQAEESASAAQQLRSQSESLQQIMQRLAVTVRGGTVPG